jgi:hypothetical protein
MRLLHVANTFHGDDMLAIDTDDRSQTGVD